MEVGMDRRLDATNTIPGEAVLGPFLPVSIRVLRKYGGEDCEKECGDCEEGETIRVRETEVPWVRRGRQEHCTWGGYSRSSRPSCQAS